MKYKQEMLNLQKLNLYLKKKINNDFKEIQNLL